MRQDYVAFLLRESRKSCPQRRHQKLRCAAVSGCGDISPKGMVNQVTFAALTTANHQLLILSPFPLLLHMKLLLALMYVTKKYESHPSPPLTWLADGSGFVVNDSNRACEEMAPFCILGNKPLVTSLAKGPESAVNFHSFTRKLHRWGFRQFQHRIGCSGACFALNDQGHRCRFLEIQVGAPGSDLAASPTCKRRIAFRHALFHRDHPELAIGIKEKPHQPIVKAAMSPQAAATKRSKPMMVRDGRKKKRSDLGVSISNFAVESRGAPNRDESEKVRSTNSLFILETSRSLDKNDTTTVDRSAHSGPTKAFPSGVIFAWRTQRLLPISISQNRSPLGQSLHEPFALPASLCGTANNIRVKHLQLRETILLQKLLDSERQTMSMKRLLTPTRDDWLQSGMDVSGISSMQPHQDPRTSIFALTAPIKNGNAPSGTASVLSAALTSFQERLGRVERVLAGPLQDAPARFFPLQSDRERAFANTTNDELTSFLASRPFTNR
jgi:HSF-type DNA-binding